MRALDRKLFRDLWGIKGQATAIALVIAAGVTMYVTYLSAFDSLRRMQASYYQEQRFADVFANLKRAPLSLRSRIAEIPGVADLETRVVVPVNLDVAGLPEPATGRLISIPGRRRPMLNDLVLREGRYVDPGRPGEVLIAEAFALAHGLRPGDTVTAVINGRRQRLEIAGVALSPEYIYNIRPGEMIPDDSRFGVFWMERRQLATAFDMEGGFNDVALTLMAGASVEDVIARLDRLLDQYGGLGAMPRSLQLSHWTLENELIQLQTFGFLMPMIFLSVAAFLLNIVMTRIVALQREQIAALKALGYRNQDIGMHYVKWGLVVGAAGVLTGTAAGAWLGSGLVTLYNEYFRFPELRYYLTSGTMAVGAGVSLLAAALGAVAAVRLAIRLQPAEAMRPAPPGRYTVSWVERLGLGRWLSPATRMVLRNLQRQPVRALLSIVGIAFAAAVLVVGTFFVDAMSEMIGNTFWVVQRQDATLTFVEPASASAIHEIARLPGVMMVEPMRVVPVRLRVGHRSRQTAITGLPARPQLQRVVDKETLAPFELPPQGLVMSKLLAEILGVGVGEHVSVEVLEGRRPVRSVVVSALVDEYLGTSTYMEVDALRAMMRESGTLSGATITIDQAELSSLYRRLKDTPTVAGVNLKWTAVENFKKTIAQNFNVMISFNVGFSIIIAFGVIYNAARVSLSERSRELASLRVMGFTQAEVSAILMAELATVTALAIPIGLGLGYALASLVALGFNNELYRIPLIVTFRTYVLAVFTVWVAAVLSGMVIRRKLGQLDLIGVLKTRE